MHQLPVHVLDRLPELSVLLDAHLGALQVLAGRLHEAAHTLARGASTRTVPDTCGAREDCEGQLSLLEAFRGNLRRATLHANRVLEVAGEVGGTGTTHAHLARAWVHLERDELAGARDRLDLAGVVPGGGREPWLVISSLLAHARLLTAAGEPEASLRLLAEATSTAWSTGSAEWFRDLLAVDSAEFLIAAGEPQRALALVTPLPPRAAWSPRSGRGRRAGHGDIGAGRVPCGHGRAALLGAPAGVQIRSWLLEARLAQDQGDADRARLLVDRALRVGAAEELRRPFAHDWAWLRSYLETVTLPCCVSTGRSWPRFRPRGPLSPRCGRQQRATVRGLSERSPNARVRCSALRPDVLDRGDRTGPVRLAQHGQDAPEGDLRKAVRKPSGGRGASGPSAWSLLTGSEPRLTGWTLSMTSPASMQATGSGAGPRGGVNPHQGLLGYDAVRPCQVTQDRPTEHSLDANLAGQLMTRAVTRKCRSMCSSLSTRPTPPSAPRAGRRARAYRRRRGTGLLRPVVRAAIDGYCLEQGLRWMPRSRNSYVTGGNSGDGGCWVIHSNSRAGRHRCVTRSG